MVLSLHGMDRQLQVISVKVFLKEVEFTESSFFLRCQLQICWDGTVIGVISKKFNVLFAYSQNKVLDQYLVNR